MMTIDDTGRLYDRDGRLVGALDPALPPSHLDRLVDALRAVLPYANGEDYPATANELQEASMEGYEEGYEQGYREGLEEGYRSGHEVGYEGGCGNLRADA